jgi:Uma2 family endonuclease
MASQIAARLTWKDYLGLPDDGRHYELIDGELIVNPAPAPRHQRIVRTFITRLDRYFEEHGGGEVIGSPIDVVLGDDTVVEPDVIVIKSERASIVGAKNVQGAPNIVVEVLSEGTRRKDEVSKRRLYEQSGVDEYWIADPDADLVKLYRRAGAGFALAAEVSADRGEAVTSPLLPAFSLDVRSIFGE